MQLKLESILIKGLFSYQEIFLSFNDVTVLVGKNGLGKTTILKIINGLVTGVSNSEMDLCEYAELTLNDGSKITCGIDTDNIIPKEFTVNNFFATDVKKHLNHINHSRFLKKYVGDALKNYRKNKTKESIVQVLTLMDILSPGDKDKSELVALFNGEMDKERNHRTISHLKNECSFCYISTINMSANAIQSITMSDGNIRNVLDIELMKELSLLEKNPDSIYLRRFRKVATQLFSDSNKAIRLSKENKIIVHDSMQRENIAVSNLSSGERQLLYILSKVANTRNKPSFILMDEPEISLHLSWQERLIDTIKIINPNSQIIVVTHSPAIVMEGYLDSYIDMKNITKVN
ncbi:TPA: ATP-binding protein [Klebsiella aerogenes]|nr:ATP-binding protein [Klebsiella aerogenes]HEO9305492.1 ATP-binding protein [Klebsiella aerogenes]